MEAPEYEYFAYRLDARHHLSFSCLTLSGGMVCAFAAETLGYVGRRRHLVMYHVMYRPSQ